MHFPILRGKLAGTRWIVPSAGKIARTILGTYEKEQTHLFERYIKPGMTVFDVGAHAGYYTLLSSVLVGNQGRVVAFEPAPRNLYFLYRHTVTNGCRNVTVVGAALGEKDGLAHFECGRGSGTGHLGDGAITLLTVPVVTLDQFVRSTGDGKPDFIKMDIEGAELGALKGGLETLSRGPLLSLSTHGPEIHQECCRLLHRLGYILQPIDSVTLESASEIFCKPG